MKRYSLMISLSIALVLFLASASLAVFPVPDGTVTMQMRQGWFGGQLAWYICTDTNNVKFAFDYNLTLAPKLSSATFHIGAIGVYIVLNPAATQGPVFTQVPGGPFYSPILRVRYVTWNPGATKVPLISSSQIATLQGLGDVTVTDTEIRLDYPIVAVGPLGGPWVPAPPGTYRIPQGKVAPNYTLTKLISLPFFKVFGESETTERVFVTKVIIPDSATARGANLLKANLAPGMANYPFSDTTRLWFIEGGPYDCQLPVVQRSPTAFSWRNTDFGYSPVKRLVVLDRSNLAPSTVVDNDEYIWDLLSSVGLVVIDDRTRLNAPEVP